MSDAMGFVTAGGKSSRMGADKAWLKLDGRPMIEHVIAALTPVVSSVAIIANRAEYQRLGFPVIADTNVDIGPLEAIRTALANSTSSKIILVACDLPFITSDLLRFLLSLSGDRQSVVPIGSDNRFEPLCAVYSREALPVVEEIIHSGQRRISPLFDRVPTRVVAFDELRHLSGFEQFFENINTIQDYQRALKNSPKLRTH